MVKDVSKYLFKRDPKCVNPSFMEDGLDIRGFVDECLLLGLSISGAVKKLTRCCEISQPQLLSYSPHRGSKKEEVH